MRAAGCEQTLVTAAVARNGHDPRLVHGVRAAGTGGNEQTAGTTAVAEVGMAQETATVTRVSLGEGEYEVID